MIPSGIASQAPLARFGSKSAGCAGADRDRVEVALVVGGAEVSAGRRSRDERRDQPALRLLLPARLEREIEDDGLQLPFGLRVQGDLEVDLPLVGVGKVPLGEVRRKGHDRDLAFRPGLPAVSLSHLGADHLPRRVDVVPPHRGHDELLGEAEHLVGVRPEVHLHVRLHERPAGGRLEPRRWRRILDQDDQERDDSGQRQESCQPDEAASDPGRGQEGAHARRLPSFARPLGTAYPPPTGLYGTADWLVAGIQ